MTIGEKLPLLGRSLDPAAGFRVVVWDGELSCLPSDPTFSASGLDINERGDVVGFEGGRAVLWRSGKAAQPIGGSVPIAVNNSGWITGWVVATAAVWRY